MQRHTARTKHQPSSKITAHFDLDGGKASATRIAQIMSQPPLCLDPDLPAGDARELLLEYGLSVAPVVDHLYRPVGVIALRDLIWPDSTSRYDLEEGLYSTTPDGLRQSVEVGFHLDRLASISVADRMMHMVFQLPVSASIARASALMAFEEVSQVIVVGTDGSLCGMVTSDDVTRWIASESGYWPRSSQRSELDDETPEDRLAFARKRDVLVVEDDAAICESLVQLLEEEGYTGVKALNGRQALELLKEQNCKPGLILLDLMMPEMNGWEFRDAQLRDPELCSIPVVVFTANQQVAEASRELRSPAAFLRKPVEIDALLETIATHFGTATEPN